MSYIKVSNARRDFETELRQELANRQAAQAKHEEEMLRSQRDNLETLHKQNIQKALLDERKSYADKLATATAKLSALEVFLNGTCDFTF